MSLFAQGLGPLQLSATFNGSGRQTSAYGEWMSSTISDSGTWVTTGTGASTDSSTLSLSFSGGVTLGEGGPGVSVSGSHERASRSTAATAYSAEKGWHTTSGSRSQSGSGSGNVGTTAGYGIVGGSGAGFSYEFSLNSTSGPSGTSSTSGSASATLSWSGTGDTGQTGGGITARARYGDGEGWHIVSVGPATTAGPEGVPGAMDLGTAAAGDDAQFSGDESSRQGQAAANGTGDAAAVSTAQSWWHWFGGSRGDVVDQACNVAYGAGDAFTLNLSWLLRSGLTSDQADYNGPAYSAGGWAGFAADLATGAGVLKHYGKRLLAEGTEQVAKRVVATKGVRGVLDGLPGKTGKTGPIKEVPDAKALDDLFDSLGSGGKNVNPGAYPGVVKELPDGTILRRRPGSKSGGATLDITMPDGTIIKVHIKK